MYDQFHTTRAVFDSCYYNDRQMKIEHIFYSDTEFPTHSIYLRELLERKDTAHDLQISSIRTQEGCRFLYS